MMRRRIRIRRKNSRLMIPHRVGESVSSILRLFSIRWGVPRCARKDKRKMALPVGESGKLCVLTRSIL